MAPEAVNLLIPFQKISPEHRSLVGGKGLALAMMSRSGIKVPPGVVITTQAYGEFVSRGGLREQISLELSRKRFEDMRWEELWDAALRIRNMFLTTPLTDDLGRVLEREIRSCFPDQAVVVRSSAPAEDSAKTSFAGLHESYVNVKGVSDILKNIRLVWASLWSDRALLYRQELGLDAAHSTMAVVVQSLVAGERSGIAFTRSPLDPSQAAVEAVYGLNQGLVDGDIDPDRWMLDRTSGRVLSHVPSSRERKAVPTENGVVLAPLTPEERGQSPLSEHDLNEVFDLAMSAESYFQAPQDVEWTFREHGLYALQSRPITGMAAGGTEDNRGWYRSLTRTFENLKALRRTVEGDRLPAMDMEAEALAKQDLCRLSDASLAEEIERRGRINEKWKQVYWDEFIPLAHGVRLFGQVYNDVVQPEDPFEFTRLLGATDMISLERNRELERMASELRCVPEFLAHTQEGDTQFPADICQAVDAFVERFGLPGGMTESSRAGIMRLLAEMAQRPSVEENLPPADIDQLREKYLSCFPAERQTYGTELLDLGRASYRLRDNDNVYLGAIERQWLRAAEEGRRRPAVQGFDNTDALGPPDIAKALRGEPLGAPIRSSSAEKVIEPGLEPRQLLGQPAGPGIATGPARVICSEADVFEVKSGDVLVCDAIDPNMTFVVPLAAAVVERRGGMLIHGAIIAREYGLPCVTGVPNVTSMIRTGDRITVDGYLGIVVVRRREGS